MLVLSFFLKRGHLFAREDGLGLCLLTAEKDARPLGLTRLPINNPGMRLIMSYLAFDGSNSSRRLVTHDIVHESYRHVRK